MLAKIFFNMKMTFLVNWKQMMFVNLHWSDPLVYVQEVEDAREVHLADCDPHILSESEQKYLQLNKNICTLIRCIARANSSLSNIPSWSTSARRHTYTTLESENGFYLFSLLLWLLSLFVVLKLDFCLLPCQVHCLIIWISVTLP